MIFIVLAGVILYGVLWSFLAIHSKNIRSAPFEKGPDISLPSFSVIIPIHNEEKRLPTLIQSLLNQDIDWQNGEIIFALNRCDDQSETMVASFCQEHSFAAYFHLREIPEGWSPKKYALSRAIERAKGEIILQTDADAILPENWISTHLRAHHSQPDTYALFGLYHFQERNSIFGKWLKTDRLWTFLISLVFTSRGYPILGFGVNFSYKNQKAVHLKSLAVHKHVLSGDDDLMIQALSKEGLRIDFLGDKSAWPETRLPENVKELWKQRKRHLNAGLHYPFAIQLFYAAFIFSWTMVLISPLFTIWGYGFLLLKGWMDRWLLRKNNRWFPVQVNIWDMFIYEIFYVPYIWMAGIASVLSRPRWN
jgi:cellulose synthase/poly-beta-1,6-N-acetylglucosamine synthase-like glycosyltransferase